jgi:hypothetical protein
VGIIKMKNFSDGISKADIEIRPYQLLSTVCFLGGVECPLSEKDMIINILKQVGNNPALRIRLLSDADEIPYRDVKDDLHIDQIYNRKRDLDVLQKLGLVPGDTRRARYLYELLFQRITTPKGICSYNTHGWEGCPHADSGAYESIINKSFSAIVYMRSDDERKSYKNSSVLEIQKAEKLYIRPHHLMCMCCHYDGGRGDFPLDQNNLYELLKRIQDEPKIPIVLVEGCCMVCDPCDGYDLNTGRCVHGGGLIRDYKKDLDVFQKLGLMPDAEMKAFELLKLLFERIPSTKYICGYGDGVLTSNEWSICGGPDGNDAYMNTIKKGIF